MERREQVSTAARKARKRAGIKFEKAAKRPTRKYRTKREQQRSRARLRSYFPFNFFDIGGVR